MWKILKEMGIPDFTRASVVKKQPCSARDTDLSPGPGRFPHAMGKLGLFATTTEPEHLDPMLRDKRSHCNEKSAHCNKE